jgi:hypothetical protein
MPVLAHKRVRPDGDSTREVRLEHSMDDTGVSLSPLRPRKVRQIISLRAVMSLVKSTGHMVR